jgi:hypothetical protein
MTLLQHISSYCGIVLILFFKKILRCIHVSGFSIKCSIAVSISARYRYTYLYPCRIDGWTGQGPYSSCLPVKGDIVVKDIGVVLD